METDIEIRVPMILQINSTTQLYSSQILNIVTDMFNYSLINNDTYIRIYNQLEDILFLDLSELI